MAGLARNIGRCTMTEAELRGAYDDLQQAWFCGTRRVVLELDSLVLVNLRCNSFDSQHSNALAVGGQYKKRIAPTKKAQHVEPT
ncbi:hypothetical protein J1N35_031258 [Gossypium stocksii]|uniref:RNase H type-1 domain-containing protein n=1 Tax=Gossypium stocksii TaxID=47602 RepID=A0A9D3V161_9ROSI|nr:hypothetical protein J1N35_031258 [Gossypium stocksii]